MAKSQAQPQPPRDLGEEGEEEEEGERAEKGWGCNQNPHNPQETLW